MLFFLSKNLVGKIFIVKFLLTLVTCLFETRIGVQYQTQYQTVNKIFNKQKKITNYVKL